jgi:hypothetical protein
MLVYFVPMVLGLLGRRVCTTPRLRRASTVLVVLGLVVAVVSVATLVLTLGGPHVAGTSP